MVDFPASEAAEKAATPPEARTALACRTSRPRTCTATGSIQRRKYSATSFFSAAGAGTAVTFGPVASKEKRATPSSSTKWVPSATHARPTTSPSLSNQGRDSASPDAVPARDAEPESTNTSFGTYEPTNEGSSPFPRSARRCCGGPTRVPGPPDCWEPPCRDPCSPGPET